MNNLSSNLTGSIMYDPWLCSKSLWQCIW